MAAYDVDGTPFTRCERHGAKLPVSGIHSMPPECGQGAFAHGNEARGCRDSQCSVQFGTGLTSAAPGSAQSTYLIVSDIEATRDELVGLGVAVSPVFHCETGFACRFGDDDTNGRVSGSAPERATYASFASFADPDGNGWLLQEITTRLPGR